MESDFARIFLTHRKERFKTIGIFVIKRRGGYRACANWKSRTNIGSLYKYTLYNIVWCAWGTCLNDSRFPHLLKKNANGDEVFFLHFLGSKYHGEKRRRWIQARHRGDGFVCTEYSYICSLHFVGENGPTAEYPDPTSAVLSIRNM